MNCLMADGSRAITKAWENVTDTNGENESYTTDTGPVRKSR